MSAGIFAAVMAAAFLHAAWNSLIKFGASKITGMLILTIVQGVAGLVILLMRDLPGLEVVPWLAASGLFHAGYKLFLALAYEQGDLSRVYPIARGTAPLIVMALSGLVLTDALTGWEYAGIAVLGAGILGMARGVFSGGEAVRLLPFALGSAAMTAGYSIVDGLGARVSGDAVTFVAWLFFLDMVLFTPVCLALRGRDVLRADRRAWGLGALAAAASYGAYAIAVWAMTVAPIALVAALRESSILFAVLIGWLVLGERMHRGKALSALLIVAGVALTRL
ncbi:EamA-like transporter family protein [Palleronia salina]|uniref:EamA-like transporter family protein n=1 Tax=Palleronia salina TaxID=313368 RepID=A0A1M6LCV6_9RHOB|nr:DMT family transporter [Palleronia salina]SHJ69002.1 EamA-like transporter family protein [Palleronia salina]